jgi:hypothetical protein
MTEKFVSAANIEAQTPITAGLGSCASGSCVEVISAPGLSQQEVAEVQRDLEKKYAHQAPRLNPLANMLLNGLTVQTPGANNTAPTPFTSGYLQVDKIQKPKHEPAPISVHSTTDARVWADEFCRIAETKGLSIDNGWMLSWFANAIMTGHDHAERKHGKEVKELGTIPTPPTPAHHVTIGTSPNVSLAKVGDVVYQVYPFAGSGNWQLIVGNLVKVERRAQPAVVFCLRDDKGRLGDGAYVDEDLSKWYATPEKAAAQFVQIMEKRHKGELAALQAALVKTS